MKNHTAAPYVRRAYYYETDKMGVIHHSNYVRWMEEARTDFMRKNSLDFSGLEKDGIVVPVVGLTCDYSASVRNDDLIEIHTRLVSFNGVKAVYQYEILLADSGKLAASGQTVHCFMDEKSKLPVNLKKKHTAVYKKSMEVLEEE